MQSLLIRLDVYLYPLSNRKKTEYENFQTTDGRLIFILIIQEVVSIQCKIHTD